MADLRRSLKRQSLKRQSDAKPAEAAEKEGKSVLANKLSILALQIGYMGKPSCFMYDHIKLK